MKKSEVGISKRLNSKKQSTNKPGELIKDALIKKA